MSWFIFAIVVSMVTGFLGRYVAKEKNRSSSEGFILGFFFNLLGVVIVALLPTKEAKVAPKKVELTEEQFEEKNKEVRALKQQEINLKKRELELAERRQRPASKVGSCRRTGG